MWSLVAWAAPAVVVVRPDHTVVGTLEVALAPEIVRDKIADPVWIARIDGGGTSVVIESRDGGCLVMESTSPTIMKTVKYRVRRCPTTDGFQEVLVSSETFDAYQVDWSVVARTAGSTVRYEIRTHTQMMVPQFVIDQQTQRGVQRMLDHLSGALEP
jgi:hypothetical protein